MRSVLPGSGGTPGSVGVMRGHAAKADIPLPAQLQRNILASNPRVTRFHINWDNNMDSLEAIENQDPALGCGLPLSCAPIKGLGLPGCIPGLLPENSMDCI